MAVDRWTGRHAVALRRANRMTIEQFARHLGMSARGVANWSQKPDVVLATLTQQIFDAALADAPPDVQERFEELLAGEGLEPTEASTSVADDSADLDTWNLAEAIVRSSISPQVMDRFERLIAAQAGRYSSSPPADMWPVVRRELRAPSRPYSSVRACASSAGSLQ
jgi:hypothetical protein